MSDTLPAAALAGEPARVRPALAALRLALGALALAAIARQLVVHLRLGFDVVNFFSYFTNLSNLFAAAVLIFGAFQVAARRAPTPSTDLLRAAAAVCMAVVGIVFTALLRDTDLGALIPWVNTVAHYVMPVAVVAEWVAWPPRFRVGARQLVLCQLFPLLYLAYTLARGAATGWYPYPFLNPATVGGYGGVAAYSVAIVLVFAVVGVVVLALGNQRSASTAA